jgi:hypothetical protein
VLPPRFRMVWAPGLPFSRLNCEARALPVYASRPGSPLSRARLGSGGRQLCRVGVATYWVPVKSFSYASLLHGIPLSQAWPGAPGITDWPGREGRSPWRSPPSCDWQLYRGRVGRLASLPPHRSGRADFPHPVPRVTVSLPDATLSGRTWQEAADSALGVC